MGENSSGFTNEQSPQGGAFSRDFLDQKSKSPLFPGPVGAVVTNDWCINVDYKSKYNVFFFVLFFFFNQQKITVYL